MCCWRQPSLNKQINPGEEEWWVHESKASSKAPLLLLCKLSHPDPNSGWLVKGLPQRRCRETPWANLVSHFKSQLAVVETVLCRSEVQRSNEAGTLASSSNALAPSSCLLCQMDQVPLCTLRTGMCSLSIPIPPEDSCLPQSTQMRV